MKKALLLTAMVLCFAVVAKAQPNPNCIGLKNPTNFTLTGNHFEKWTGYTGTKNSTLSTCTGVEGGTYGTPIQAADLEAVNNTTGCSITLYQDPNARTNSRDIHNQSDGTRQFVIKGPGYDPETMNRLSYLPPDTSFHSSIRLGNYCGSAGAEKLTYEIRIMPENAMLTIWFALSLQNGKHSTNQNPEFVIMVEKNIGTTANPNWQPLAHDTLCYIRPTPSSSFSAAAGDTAFRAGATGAPLTSSSTASSGHNLYLPWRKVMINLSDYTYQTVRLRITAGDCSQSAHYAMAYIAGDCQSKDLQATGCAAGESNNVTVIKAPKGAISYAWYRSKTGQLLGDAQKNMNNYVPIEGVNTDSLGVTLDQFRNVNTNAVIDLNTFMCIMSTKMNDTKVVQSKIYTDVGNTKPVLVVDSALNCDAGITMWDYSYAPYTQNNEANEVDTNLTVWEFYTSYPPTPATLVGTYTGGHATHYYDQPTSGNTRYSVKVRSSAANTTCWNEKTVEIRTIKRPVPSTIISKDLNTLCKGDTIYITDLTPGSTFHRWFFSNNDTSFTVDGSTAATRLILDTTTRVTLLTRSRSFFRADTTGDGLVEDVYCYSDTTFDIVVGQFPKLTVMGDTIVCNGDQSNVTVQSDVANCTYNWYQVYEGNTPVVENNPSLATALTQDRTYYVKVVSPFGCTSWDSINLYLVKPDLRVKDNKDKICTGDSTYLIAGRAAYFDWTSNPPDPDLEGQSTNDSIKVMPKVTTVYSVVGHGTNGCGATALTQKITVYPYPIMQVQLTPDYIDSENPSVQFSDLSEYGTSSLWNFGNGNTSTTRSVVFTFTDLSQDSILITLVTGNAIGCTNDTSFYVPVGIFAVWFPNAFTPKLETNNIFKPFTANTLEDYELRIFDRGGAQVFMTNDIEEGWDGTYKGQECKQGAYVYIATYRRQGVERLMSQKGTLTLLR
ncbi:MAG: gliding motility-associated C-terminal domain-containing protein [Bacteroidales bacterium]|nr:gliding motility-associated C-terminal domain-containing protein [Bacteroidales bacterium]